MIDFFPIETPYSSEDYKIMKAVVNKGIDSHLEGFTKSKFTKSPTFANKFLWNIHESELPILYRRLEELYAETGNEDYESFLNDVKHVAGTNKTAAAGALEPELDEMLNPYDPMDANQTINGEPTSTSDLAGNEFEMDEAELREMIRRQLHHTSQQESIENYIDDDTKAQELASENDSDSLRNKHGENLKPQESIEEDSQLKRHQAGQREKIDKIPLGQHSPHSQAAIKENKNGNTSK